MGIKVAPTCFTVVQLSHREAVPYWKECDAAQAPITMTTPLSEAVYRGGIIQMRDQAQEIFLVSWQGEIKPVGVILEGIGITAIADSGVVFTGAAQEIGYIEYLPTQGGQRALIYINIMD
jgi:hypothetical protein